MNTPSPLKTVGCVLALVPVLGFAGCSGGTAGDRANRGDFKVNRISTGRGPVYPYRIRQVDSFGNPTSTVLTVEDRETLVSNVTGSNGVLPVARFDTSAVLPDGSPGNQYLHFEFSHKLEVESILSPLLANQTNSGLTTAVSILAYDPATEQTTTLQGRGFVNGYTFYNVGGQLELVKAVEEDGNGNVTILDPRAQGFPQFAGAEDLVGVKSFTFVADTDGGNGDLTDNETFTSTDLIRIVVTNAVRDTDGGILEQEVCTATTVGADPNPPEVLGYTSTPQISPGNGDTGVDTTTSVVVRFNKPVQPGDVGTFFDPTNLTPSSGGITLNVTLAAQTFPISYYADPLNFGDLCNYRLQPAYNFPGETSVDVTVQNTTIRGLGGTLIGQAVTTSFSTAEGPGIINAPVAPDAIYLGIGGPEPGLSVIDLNGFGQGTGDIDNTRFPLNPNVGAPGVTPSLSPGSTNLDAGSGGVLTLVKDTSLNTKLVSSPLLGTVGDIMVGAPLDLVFNNENINRNASRANQLNPVTLARMTGNSITQPPHPNPPRLKFPPPNPSQAIFGEQPTVASTAPNPGTVVTTSPPCASMPVNQLVAGNPFALAQGEVGIFGHFSEGNFVGPQVPPQSPPPPPVHCPFAARQQVGHFLYVLDRDNRQVMVLNSNRMTVLDTIRLSDPVSMAMAPQVDRLAVTNFASSTVSFVDINPLSPTFHQVVHETRVEQGPTTLAWQPDGEDILVLSPGSNAMSILSASDFSVRRTVSGFINNPVEVVATERFVNSGFLDGIYFAYILNGNGTVAVYESGPDGVNGIGFNDVVGTVPGEVFRRAKTMRYDWRATAGGVLIGHVDDRDVGQVSRLEMTSSPGAQPLNPNTGGFILPPTFRQKEWNVTARFGGSNPTTPVKSQFSGNSIIDLAGDEMINFGAAPGQVHQFNSALGTVPWGHSGKHSVKAVGGAFTFPVSSKLLFVGLSDVGQVDVFEIATGNKIASIDVPGIRVVAGYWRQ